METSLVKNLTEKICCNRMLENISHACKIHNDPFDCPDHLIYKSKKNEFGIIIHDGGSSFIKIDYCPWCGKRL